MNEELLLISPEEIKKLSQVLADTLIQSQTQTICEFTYVSRLEIDLQNNARIIADAIIQAKSTLTYVKEGELISQTQITEVINLDFMASSVHGITDILGQISSWFTNILNTIASWIVSSIQGFIQSIVSTISSIIDTVTWAVRGFISTAVSTISGFISGAVSTITSTIDWFIRSAVSTITGVITSIVSTLQTVISGVISAISGALQSVGSTIMSAITGAISVISGAITSAVSAIGSAITSIASTITGAISGAISAITGAITSVASAIGTAIAGVVSAVGSAISNVASAIMSAITGAVSTIASAISGIASAIMGAITGVISAISGVISTVASVIMSAISGFVKTVSDAIGAIAKSIMDAISGFIKVISDALGAIGKTILDAISGFVKTLSDIFGAVAKGIIDVIGGAIKAITDALGAVAKGIIDAIGGIIKTISDIFGAIGKTILDALSSAIKAIGDAIGAIAKGIMDGIAGIGKGIMDLWKFLVSAFQDIAAKVGAGFQVIGNALMGFINGIIQAGQWILGALQELGKRIWEALPDWLKAGLEAIGNFFKVTADMVVGFFKDPWGTLQGIVSAIWGGLKWLGERIWEGLQFIGKLIWGAIESVWNLIKGGLEWLCKAITSFGIAVISAITSAIFAGFRTIAGAIVAAVRGFVDWVLTTAGGVAEALGNLITGVVQNTIKPMWSMIVTGVTEPFTSLVQKIAKGEKTRGELTELTELFGLYTLAIVGSQYMSVGTWAALHGLATPLDKLQIRLPFRIRLRGTGKASPVGVGGEAGGDVEAGASAPITINLGLTLRHLASEVRKYGDLLGRSLMYGIGIWMSQPFMRLANAAFRNVLMVEMPSVADMAEMTRRFMSRKDFKDVLESYRGYLRLYGYNDQIIEWLTSTELKIEVTDRFGQKRTVPISLMYNLPSPSDVATMMVRDIFADIDNFLALYQARGMHPDIGALYYFLRFRYPPPERLWQFTVRGVSGLLWATLPDIEKADIRAEAERIGAPMPVAPETMNFKADKLLTAFKTYMKWHDYARFSWIKDFPSDNLIYIDTLADIPLKIDQRWMVKWGLYELLSAKKVTIQSPIKDFATKMLENTPASGIQMDLTNFSRTILATGLHPDWVPTTAVAEAMNALAEERTAIRTGFMGLFKEGFYDISALEKLLSGFVTASFQVAYFSIADMKWTTGWVNLPVMYLPPERKLLELKALMDRSLDILREIQRDISTAYQEFIIRDYNEYKAKLTSVINSINTFYASDYEAITGTKLPDELKLKFVEEYYKPYVEALKIWRDAFTVRRVRMWTQRWLGWVMYRIAYGTAKKEDVEKLVTYVSQKAKLTDYETEFIQDVMDIMYGIARQSTAAEYLPTPSTLATLSEYMTLPTELVKTVLTERGIPEEWMNFWLTYISVKPIKADAKTLLSTYVRGFRYGAVAKEKLEGFIKALPQYGFTDKEIQFVTERINIEEQILEAREYLPTPSTLATLSEYVVISQTVIDKALEARKVPEEWADIWRQYIDVRPIADDVRGLITSYRRALLYVVIPKDLEAKIIEYAKLIGFTQREFDILALRVQLEELILEARENRSEYIPTPSMLASMCEYVPEAREFFQQVIQARRVPTDWQKIWAKYIDVRPLVDDVKRYLSRAETLYVRFMTKKEDFKKILDEVADYLGYTSKEIEFLMKVTEFERYRNAWTELIGSVERLVDLSEYSPKASEYALGKLYEMIDALPLPPTEKQKLKEMWEEYIRNRPVKAEAKTYITQLINMYIEGLMPDATFKKELWEMKKWGFSDNELMFYEAQAALRRARKLKIPIGE